MQVSCLNGVPPVAFGPCDIPDSTLVMGRVSDRRDELFNEERQFVEGASEARYREFSSGRCVAHEALRLRGIADQVIGSENRRPIWPKGTCGSISHTKSLAAAVVSNAAVILSIGIDIEPVTAVSDRVAERILLDPEKDWVSDTASMEWRTTFFSAKEAVYKAASSVTDTFLGFQDVLVEINETTLTFFAKTTDQRMSSVFIEQGRGYFHRVEDHLLSLFVIERAS